MLISQIYKLDIPGNILSALGQTLIGSSVVSFFLTLDDVQKLFLGTIKEVLVDCNVDELFNKKYLERVHSICHEKLHFQNMEISEKDWKDLSNKCIKTFTSPYYNYWRENIECSLKNNKIEKRFSISYELINPMVEGSITANVSWNCILDIPNKENKNDYIFDLSLILLLDGKEIKCHPFVDFSPNDNKVYNTKAVIKCNEYNLDEISFNKKLKVDMKLTTKVSINDKSYTHRLRYATRDYLFNFTCTDSSVSLYPNFFGGFIEHNDFNRHNVDSYVLVECKDKLILPGSGASIVLNFNKITNKNGKRRKLLKK